MIVIGNYVDRDVYDVDCDRDVYNVDCDRDAYDVDVDRDAELVRRDSSVVQLSDQKRLRAN